MSIRLAAVAPRRGRPRKFNGPSRAVTLTLPENVLAALGALDRKLYVAPSRKLVVVRMGQAAPDKDFDQQLWLRLAKALG